MITLLYILNLGFSRQNTLGHTDYNANYVICSLFPQRIECDTFFFKNVRKQWNIFMTCFLWSEFLAFGYSVQQKHSLSLPFRQHLLDPFFLCCQLHFSTLAAKQLFLPGPVDCQQRRWMAFLRQLLDQRHTDQQGEQYKQDLNTMSNRQFRGVQVLLRKQEKKKKD